MSVRTIGIVVCLFLISGTVVSTAGDADWYDGPWTYRQKITIAATNVSEDLTDFPVLISTTDTALKKARSDGSDFMVTASDGTTKLDQELEKFDSGTGELALWVRASTLSSSSNNEFYIYYGNPEGSESDSTNVWSSAYRMVQHMDQDPEDSSPQIIDSTSNDADLTCQGTMTSNNLIAGNIGDALDFDGSDDQLYRADDGTLDPSSSFTVSAWVWHDNGSADNIIYKMEKDYNAYQGYFFGSANYSSYGGNVFELGINGVNTPDYVATSWFSAGEWHYVAGVVDRSTSPDSMRLYVDGILSNTDTNVDATKDDLNGPAFYIAKPIGGHQLAGNWDGKLDEVRIIFTARSTGWIETEYANQNNPSAFMTFAEEEALPPGTFLNIL